MHRHDGATAAPPLSHDREQIADFFGIRFADLTALLAGERIEIRTPKGQRKQAFFTSVAEAAAYVAALPVGVDTYYGINPRLDDEGTEESVSRITCLWADLDFKKFKSEAEALAMVDGFELPPTLTVRTGGGLHLYWHLSKPLFVETDGARVRAVLKRLYARLGGLDNVGDPPRIFRIPGTFNNKAEYGGPRPVRQILHDPSALYTIEDFERCLPEMHDRLSGAASGTSAAGSADNNHWTLDEVRGMLACIDAADPINSDHGGSDGYWGWMRISAALVTAFPDNAEAEALWEEWSQQRLDKGSNGNAKSQPRKLSSFKRKEGQERVTIGTIIHYAESGGWISPRARMSMGDKFVNSYPRQNLPPAVPFPIHVLPGPLRKLVEEGAAAYDMPPDFIAVPALVFSGACIGRTFALDIKPGFRSFPNLYAAVVGVPGSGKTPGANLARQPLDHLEDEATTRYNAAMASYEQAEREWKKTGADQGEPRPTPPRRERFHTADATTEALGILLRDSPGIAVERDELISLLTSMDAYRGGKGDDRQRWLSNWSAKSWIVDRKRSESPHIRYPTPGIIGGIQPALLPRLANEAGQEDGFIDRFLFSYPEADICDWTEESVGDETRRAVRKQYAALRGAARTGEPRVLEPTAEAKATYVAWFRKNVGLQRRESGLVRGVYAKLPQQLSRLALNLHCLRHGGRSDEYKIDDATMRDAIELTEYFRAHAHRVIPSLGLGGAKQSIAQKIMARLLDTPGEWVARTDLYKHLSGNADKEGLSAALDELKEQGRAECRTVYTGNRPREDWRAITDE